MKKNLYVAILLNLFGMALFSQEKIKTYTKDGRELNITKYGSHSSVSKKAKITKKKSHLNFGSAYSMNTALSVSVVPTNVTCYFYNDGSAQAAVTGGTPPYQYFWLPTGDTASSVTNLSAGTYTVIVLDSLCSMDTASFSITEPAPLISNSYGISTSCNNCDGLAYITTTDSASYSIVWNNSLGTNDSITNLCGGYYSGTITSTTSGCTQNYTIYVASYIDSVDFTFDGTCVSNPYTFYPTYIYPFSAFADYSTCYNPQTWSWNFGDSLSVNNTDSVVNPSHLFTAPGNYLVTLVVNGTDTVRKSIVVSTPQASFDGFSDCSSPPTVIFFDESNCASTWYWNFGDPASGAANIDSASIAQHSFSAAGSYNITLIINAGAADADTLAKTYTFTNYPPVNLGNDTIITHGDTITLNMGSMQQQYSWSTGDTTPTISVSTAGVYSVTGFDSLGCSSADDKLVLLCGYHITTNVTPPKHETRVSLFPSPARNTLTLETSGIAAEGVLLSLYDVCGREIKKIRITDVRTTFDCSSFAGGIYFYQLTDSKKIISSGKFIKE